MSDNDPDSRMRTLMGSLDAQYVLAAIPHIVGILESRRSSTTEPQIQHALLQAPSFKPLIDAYVVRNPSVTREAVARIATSAFHLFYLRSDFSWKSNLLIEPAKGKWTYKKRHGYVYESIWLLESGTRVSSHSRQEIEHLRYADKLPNGKEFEWHSQLYETSSVDARIVVFNRELQWFYSRATICLQCKSELPPDAKVCKYCGREPSDKSRARPESEWQPGALGPPLTFFGGILTGLWRGAICIGLLSALLWIFDSSTPFLTAVGAGLVVGALVGAIIGGIVGFVRAVTAKQ